MGKKKIEKIKKEIEKFKKNVGKRFGIEKIIIFGSAARGKMNKHSDVDMIIVSRKYGRKDVFRIVPKLYGEWKGGPADIILFNKKEFEKLKKEISIVSEALREGIEI
jgi:predicted nucleotidyltransferase